MTRYVLANLTGFLLLVVSVVGLFVVAGFIDLRVLALLACVACGVAGVLLARVAPSKAAPREGYTFERER